MERAGPRVLTGLLNYYERPATVDSADERDTTRRRTQDDQLPQTLFRIPAKAGAPVLVTVPLRIER
jgi:hypothetical protein